jgi:hypothetical protein
LDCDEENKNHFFGNVEKNRIRVGLSEIFQKKKKELGVGYRLVSIGKAPSNNNNNKREDFYKQCEEKEHGTVRYNVTRK